MLGYLGWVAVRTGDLGGWFGVQQRGWGTKFDGGAATWTFALQHLGNPRSALEILTVWLLVAAIVLVFYAFQRRLEWPLIVLRPRRAGHGHRLERPDELQGPAAAARVHAADPAGTGAGPARPSTVLTVLGLVTLFSAWFGAYSIAVWDYAI